MLRQQVVPARGLAERSRRHGQTIARAALAASPMATRADRLPHASLAVPQMIATGADGSQSLGVASAQRVVVAATGGGSS